MRLASALLVFVVILTFASCAKRSRSAAIEINSSSKTENGPTSPRININTASATELETLPGIGKGLAQRIIEHRQKYGPFAKAEHMIMVRGISEHRFQAIRDQITVE